MRKKVYLGLVFVLLGAFAYFYLSATKQKPVSHQKVQSEKPLGELKLATFAGGCFWCMEHPFDELVGVYKTISGYAGGIIENPSYKQVASGSTTHVEAVQVSYDPKQISYEKLVDVFWRNVDPTDSGGQFVDRGQQYRPAIYYHDEEQARAIEVSKNKLLSLNKFTKKIAVEISKFSTFYPAEEYHQDYYIKNPLRYGYYRNGSGRDQFLNKIWGTNK